MGALSPATARLEIVIVGLIRISPCRRGCCEPLDSTHPGTQGTDEQRHKLQAHHGHTELGHPGGLDAKEILRDRVGPLGWWESGEMSPALVGGVPLPRCGWAIA
ncbi:hypothetical protein GCM10023094_55860 [Rhodococcus olei]|uniref:Uncharacterized protein n=1 Tax=Rhodococcus olei TaxID=2161675 RepID=A0ABP8PT46_9NOCA